ncbi:formate dehydrogenase accessory sulfurtransferase FdhD [Clostridium estertheticum]|uniref:formate dehydrogenase accessory sulfurtransferase FdhD n=1 Tax=Clostridium estertheticum TaxID=238834 RepID=UPI0013E92BD7|nr:formate dehydrogenase accessory sulfurtransferase FdhD [Clostridium estertheticum]MBZ9686166.1 formate dehydrogenase accessory sulfurtransferase FdhD [Clostridium estertheticum]
MNITKEVNIKKINKELQEDTLDIIIEEVSLEIFVNHEFYATLMCTPIEVKELAVGFLFSEGVITSTGSIESIEEKYENRVCIILDHEITVDPSSARAITSGCGKGSIHVISLEECSINFIESNCKYAIVNILELMGEFNSKSELFKQTGGVHSCCICSYNNILLFSEDIGRHNALDKVLGKALLSNMDLKDKLIMTTGRISSDIVVKVSKAGIPIIVSHSAPTSLALSIAKAANITIIGFARGSRMNIYCKKYRIF